MPLGQDGKQHDAPSKGTISEALKKLREAGLVDEDNTLTKAGKESLEAVWPNEEE
jgi:HrpA-like RNA helicase